uniref:Uncharacterized protein n=1 Tax=Cryptomonas curvata TaxID=233186 RepID=A0A6T7YBG7_9CRYP
MRCSMMRLHISQLGRMAVAPEGKKSTGGGKKGKDNNDDSRFKLLIKALEQKGPKKYVRDAKQMEIDQQIAKEFTRQSFRRENKFLANMQQKIRLRDIAVAALPAELQAEGRTNDMEPYPMDRHMATHTPPIPGFREQQSKKNSD